jgi:hypothetical protein
LPVIVPAATKPLPDTIWAKHMGVGHYASAAAFRAANALYAVPGSDGKWQIRVHWDLFVPGGGSGSCRMS